MSNALTRSLNRMPGARLLPSILVAAAVIGVILAFARWAAAPEWGTLSRNLPLDQVGRITTALDEVGIEYRLEHGGTSVAVPMEAFPRARVHLAEQGLPAAGEPGFELFDQPSWSMTDFTQRVNYRRALEGELESTIRAMRGIEDAQVHLGLRESSVLRRTGDPVKASVVITSTLSAEPDGAVVRGIAALVAGSVEDLQPENVRVLDDSGQLLAGGGAGGGMTETMSDQQLAVRREVEEYLEEKAEALVFQMVGAGNATVRVSASLNFDRIDRTVRSVDPTEQLTTREDRSEITPSTEDQGAASVVTNTTYYATRTVESVARGGARVERLTVAVLVNDRMEEVAIEGGGSTVRYQARSPDELARIEALVRNAVGVSVNRGDEISVASVPFPRTEAPVVEEEPPSVPTALVVAQQAWRPALGLLGAIFSFLIGLRLLSQLKEADLFSSSGVEALPAGESSGTASADSIPQPDEGRPAPRSPAPDPGPEVADPALTARVMKAWLKEA